MGSLSRTYYLFLGFHGFLLGLFPFFLPVYLYKNSVSLSEIALFVSISGFGFVLTLWSWDRLRKHRLRGMIIASLLFELSVLFCVYMGADLSLIALFNGGYSCLYWMTQRILFFSAVSSDNSGRNFGNFQIFVLVVLKMGIFVGSMLLEKYSLTAVCFLSLAVVIIALFAFLLSRTYSLEIPPALQVQQPIRLSELISFKDRYGSRLVFALDGVFLYLESYFWLISLFLLVGESFVKLGLVVIVLALVLGILFYLIKNRIDRLQPQKVYGGAVLLYALSWAMRGSISGDMNFSLQMCMIVSIAFCTSFFRLAFNKRFFDLAGSSTGYKYIFLKSYYSQFFLAFAFLILGAILKNFSEGEELLPFLYWISGGLTFLYLKYKMHSEKPLK